MLRSLGQNPTDEEIKQMIEHFDDGDKDGKIQLREFLQMYVSGLDSKNSSQAEDVADTFRAVGADPRDEKAMVEKSVVSEFMKSMYELDVCRHNPDLSLACPTERALRTRKPPPLLNT